MKHYDKSNSQLVARCFFSKGEVEYVNYNNYYEEEQQVLDHLEMIADY